MGIAKVLMYTVKLLTLRLNPTAACIGSDVYTLLSDGDLSLGIPRCMLTVALIGIN